MNMYFAQFNMDTGCVDAWMTNGTILSIDCIAVERIEAENLYQQAELDYLIYNDPAAYVELILEGDPKKYLKAVTQYKHQDSYDTNNQSFVFRSLSGSAYTKKRGLTS